MSSEQNVETIIIRSFEDAWNCFRLATEGGSLPRYFNLVFDGWPSFDIKFNGKDWDGTVPTRIMGPLLDVQKDIHRIYANLCFGDTNLRKLSDEQRDLLELVVKVKEGSSDYRTSLDKQFTAIAHEAIKKMESKHLAVVLLGAALIYGGNDVAKQWIASQQIQKQVDQTVELSKQETERLKVFAEAVAKSPKLAEATGDFTDSQNKVLKAAKPKDKITAYGVELSGYEAQELVHKDRASSSLVEISGLFRVVSNDASKSSGYRIKVIRISDGETFTATVPFGLEQSEQKLIQAAEWSKGVKLVHLDIKANVLRDKIVNAVVTGAKDTIEER